ncbi:ESX-1 secretion-associated protein EspA [Mycolicibacterium vanbaalenii]|uniref:ESX-1 secretion-associated protein EspA n=1 Tax=Mycolicibacterium vanbaalenii TaxID=110539 RepID=A0A5S9RC22_MYCVN|nr:EspA/EspE family type VII secretion system effector [Mycolicibacterium vanbaalenii]CAA0138186.1 ESX-1 secretion-associated protein EspA [Mycolicibacterium vanbaalenii]
MSVLGEALDLLRRYGDVVGINWDKGPSILDRAVNSGVANLAASPILAAAQLTIQGMKATTGSGEPQDGEAFEKSADLYEEAGNLLIDAAPVEDRWNGTAADTYREKNNDHRHLTLEVAEADKEMRQALSRLAAEVRSTRTDLQEAIDFLSDYDTSTAWMNFVPGGAAVKAASDTAVASTQLAVAQTSIAKLVAESALVAHSMRKPLSRYTNAAALKMLDPEPGPGSDSEEVKRFPCGEPFGDERTAGRLPDRAENDQSFTPPEPLGLPVAYPPATPYGSPAPR